MIQKKKGKIEYFTVQGSGKAVSKQASSPANLKTSSPNLKPLTKKPMTVLIPKLTKAGPGEKLVRKEITEYKNGPADTSNQDKAGLVNSASSSLVNYSDSSSEEGQLIQKNADETLDMEVDEDGAPIPSSGNNKRPNDDVIKNNDMKKAKVVAADADTTTATEADNA